MSETLAVTASYKSGEHGVKTLQLFLLLAVLNLLTAFVSSRFVMTREIYYSLFSSQLETSSIDEIVNVLDKTYRVHLALIPLILLVKIAFVTLLLQFSFLLMSIEIGFKNLFRGVALANLVSIVSAVTKMAWIKAVPLDKLSFEVLESNPLALSNILNSSSYSRAAFTLLNNVNVFEFVWIAVVIVYLKTRADVQTIDACMVTILVWAFLLFGQYGLVYYFTQVF